MFMLLGVGKQDNTPHGLMRSGWWVFLPGESINIHNVRDEVLPEVCSEHAGCWSQSYLATGTWLV